MKEMSERKCILTVTDLCVQVAFAADSTSLLTKYHVRDLVVGDNRDAKSPVSGGRLPY